MQVVASLLPVGGKQKPGALRIAGLYSANYWYPREESNLRQTD